MAEMWLFATYEVKLAKPVLVKTESETPLVMSVNLKGWNSEMKLVPNISLGRIKSPAGGWYYPVSEMEITVSRDGYMGDEMVHAAAAQLMIEKLLVFLQFKMWNSLFDAIEKYQRYFSNEDDKASFENSSIRYEPQLKLVSDYDQQNMHDYMAELFSRELTESLLHDATISIAHNRNRRACLELTMACESALGMRLDIADQVKTAMGDVFRNRYVQEYEVIQRLFLVRDTIKNTGNGLFKYISAARKKEIENDLISWQAAVVCLSEWLNSMNKGLQEAH